MTREKRGKTLAVLEYCLVMSVWLIPSEQVMFTVIGYITGGVSLILVGLHIRNNVKCRRYQTEKD